MPKPHWRETAIARSEAITDAWEVTKAYAGRIAEWVLFLCMVINIIEMLPGIRLPDLIINITLGVQVVMLDVGGFSLTSMADYVREMGDEVAAAKAETTGNFLIGLMIVTLLLVSLGVLFPVLKVYTDYAEKGLILVRIAMTVIYGHVIHSLRRHHHTLGTSTSAEDIHALLSWSLVSMAAYLQQDYQQRVGDLEKRITTLVTTWQQEQQQALDLLSREQQCMLASLQEGQKSGPVIDSAEIVQHVLSQLEAQLQEMRQHMRVSQASETIQLETLSEPKKLSVSAPHRIVSLPASHPVRQRKLSQESDVETTILGLLDQDKTVTVRELARLAGASPATAGRIRKDYFERLHQAVEAESETKETDASA